MEENNNNGKVKAENRLTSLEGCLKYLSRDLGGLQKSYKVLNDHSGKQNEMLAKVSTDVDWIKRFLWIFITIIMDSYGMENFVVI